MSDTSLIRKEDLASLNLGLAPKKHDAVIKAGTLTSLRNLITASLIWGAPLYGLHLMANDQLTAPMAYLFVITSMIAMFLMKYADLNTGSKMLNGLTVFVTAISALGSALFAILGVPMALFAFMGVSMHGDLSAFPVLMVVFWIANVLNLTVNPG